MVFNVDVNVHFCSVLKMLDNDNIDVVSLLLDLSHIYSPSSGPQASSESSIPHTQMFRLAALVSSVRCLLV